MGMDIFGINPEIKSQRPEIDWETATEEQKDKYLEASAEWDAENPGYYFRNNVWHWRPLWEYICFVCSEILTEEDITSGHYNDGHKINKEKAETIAHRLEGLLIDGAVQRYADERQKRLDQLPEDDWDRSYPFSVENVEHFLAFVRESGGFTIS